jgi:hypothetical protein
VQFHIPEGSHAPQQDDHYAESRDDSVLGRHFYLPPAALSPVFFRSPGFLSLNLCILHNGVRNK